MRNLKIKFMEIIHDDLVKNHLDGTHWLASCTEAMGTRRNDINKAFQGNCSGIYLLRIVVTWCYQYFDSEKGKREFLEVWQKIGIAIFQFAHDIDDIDEWNAPYSRRKNVKKNGSDGDDKD